MTPPFLLFFPPLDVSSPVVELPFPLGKATSVDMVIKRRPMCPNCSKDGQKIDGNKPTLLSTRGVELTPAPSSNPAVSCSLVFSTCPSRVFDLLDGLTI